MLFFPAKLEKNRGTFPQFSPLFIFINMYLADSFFRIQSGMINFVPFLNTNQLLI